MFSKQRGGPPLWHIFFSDARFHTALLEADRQLASEAQARGCIVCGGTLHAAHFPRKPRGGPPLPSEHDVRLSFCCGRDGCRKRVTPPSLRFLGRRVYFATVVVLASVLRHGPTPTRMRRLQELVGVSRRTVERWCRWWRTAFVEDPFWRVISAALMPPVGVALLPSSLLDRFDGDNETRLVALLRCLGPITGAKGSQVC